MKTGVIFALLAAALFGASTPFAKALVQHASPFALAGLLYAGSGLGLLAWMGLRRIWQGPEGKEAGLTRADAPWLAAAVLAGGVVAPVLLMAGIKLIPASSASLLLNLEGVLTALLAWFIFKENYDARIVLGMALIVAAGVLLSVPDLHAMTIPWGGLLVAAACLGWAIDNNLTRKVSGSDPVQIACIKGLVAGSVNLTLAAVMGDVFPTGWSIALAGFVGLAGYGVSLVLFVLALRHLGSARTGAYFSAAPFIGAALAITVWHESPSLLFWSAGAMMGAGLWLHLSEHHEHEHHHDRLEHEHAHTHDEHHQHPHDFPWDGAEPHSHPHVHTPLTHRHPHYPDLHHQHRHS